MAPAFAGPPAMSEWQPAPVPSEPNTMSLEELQLGVLPAAEELPMFEGSTNQNNIKGFMGVSLW